MRIAAPLRTFAQRSAFFLLLTGAVAVMAIGRANPEAFDQARIAVTDFVAPLLDAVSQPVATATNYAAKVEGFFILAEENERLRLENRRLKQWQEAARALEAENMRLRDLLRYEPQEAISYITTRVIGDQGGAFLNSVLLNKGHAAGVAKGQAAISGDGLVGRVASVGERSSRVLLITDINSRIPVTIQGSRARAVLAGDNSSEPKLIFTAANAPIEVGQRVVTSGHGDAFPLGIPVGIVTEAGENGLRVTPFASFDRLELLRLVDYGKFGILTGRMDEKDPRGLSQ